jgi:diguanylate cyclase (GGDEF)-like protein
MPIVQSNAEGRRDFQTALVARVDGAERDGRTVVVYIASFLGLTALWHREGPDAVIDVMSRVHDLVLAQVPPGSEVEQLGEFEIGVLVDGGPEEARALRRRISALLPTAFDLGPEQLIQASAWTLAPDDQIATGDLVWDTCIRAIRARSNISHAAMAASIGRDPQLELLVPRLLQHGLTAFGLEATAVEVADRSWVLPERPDRPPDGASSLWTGSRSVGRMLWWGDHVRQHRTAMDEALTSVALAVERGLAIEETERRARQDSLTGLLNRDGLARAMEGVIRPCSVGIVDIDHFKTINDRYGHRVGDRMLIALADLLRLGGRSVDLVARWGGEELVVVMPGTGVDGAAAALRRYLADAMTTISAGDVSLSFSAGVVELIEDGNEALEAAVHAADVAMYEAKRAGRSQVFVGLS